MDILCRMRGCVITCTLSFMTVSNLSVRKIEEPARTAGEHRAETIHIVFIISQMCQSVYKKTTKIKFFMKNSLKFFFNVVQHKKCIYAFVFFKSEQRCIKLVWNGACKPLQLSRQQERSLLSVSAGDCDSRWEDECPPPPEGGGGHLCSGYKSGVNRIIDPEARATKE